jgi:Rrf2 family protein
MRLTSSVGYAVSILLQVHKEGTGLVTAAKISRGCKFPPRFLYRVLRRLVDAGLLVGVSGPGGGYRLARRPAQINLLEIVTAVEGQYQATRLTAACPKHRAAVTLINAVSHQIAKRASQELAKVKLSRLIKPK